MQESNQYNIKVSFVKSAEKVAQCPEPNLPEYAFIGRSNVGKSSLINYLSSRKALAKISGKPGKTKTVNHFIVDNNWYLVDLPGYGYALASKTDRKKYDQIIRSYLQRRSNLICTYILIDPNVPPQANDIEFINWMGLSGLPFKLVFTKVDKSKPQKLESNIQAFKDVLGNDWDELPPMIYTSAEKKSGKEDLLNDIFEMNKEFATFFSKQSK